MWIIKNHISHSSQTPRTWLISSVSIMTACTRFVGMIIVAHLFVFKTLGFSISNRSTTSRFETFKVQRQSFANKSPTRPTGIINLNSKIKSNQVDAVSKTTSYNDDAFGLVFLTSGLAAQDFIFAATFLFWSALFGGGTTMLAYGKRSPEPSIVKALPAIPAILSLLFMKVLELQPDLKARVLIFGGNTATPLSYASQVEYFVCGVSISWALYQSYETYKKDQ